MPLSKISKNNAPNVYAGEGELARLDELTDGFPNILLFADTNGFESCGAAAYFKKLQEKTHIKNIKTITYIGKALPIEDIETVYAEIKESGIKPDVIIAVGGGTVIDLSKIISIAYTNKCEKAEEVLDNSTLENNIPLIFIPTTAGTGSEATSFAVVYRNKVKISIVGRSLLPKYVILDPLLLQSLPEPVLNATVLDALAQATESAWAVGSTNESKEYSSMAIPLILESLEKTDRTDRLIGFQWAAYWAGRAINVSKTTLPHSISYPLTAYFGIPHGIAVFLTLAEVARLNYQATSETIQEKTDMEHVQESFQLLFRLYRVTGIDGLVQRISGVMDTLGVKNRLRDYGIGTGDLATLSEKALTKGRSDNNPRKMSPEEILDLLKRLY